MQAVEVSKEAQTGIPNKPLYPVDHAAVPCVPDRQHNQTVDDGLEMPAMRCESMDVATDERRRELPALPLARP